MSAQSVRILPHIFLHMGQCSHIIIAWIHANDNIVNKPQFLLDIQSITINNKKDQKLCRVNNEKQTIMNDMEYQGLTLLCIYLNKTLTAVFNICLGNRNMKLIILKRLCVVRSSTQQHLQSSSNLDYSFQLILGTSEHSRKNPKSKVLVYPSYTCSYIIFPFSLIRLPNTYVTHKHSQGYVISGEMIRKLRYQNVFVKIQMMSAVG